MLIRSPLTTEKAETICSWYYRFGFMGLPWLWCLNWLFFRHYADGNETIRWYVRQSKYMSLLGGLLFVLITALLLFILPSSSRLWIIRPFYDGYQWGYFTKNQTKNYTAAV